jgi:hypothetical protein
MSRQPWRRGDTEGNAKKITCNRVGEEFESHDLQSSDSPDIARRALMSVRGKSCRRGSTFNRRVYYCLLASVPLWHIY